MEKLKKRKRYKVEYLQQRQNGKSAVVTSIQYLKKEKNNDIIKKIRRITMTYKELYNAAFVENERNENDTKLEHLARIIYENNYDGITDTEEAVIRAMEILSELGHDIDPTETEFKNAIYNVDNPYPARAQRGLLKAMKNGNLFDYIARKYMAFSRTQLCDIIKELDYAFEQVCLKDEYAEAMENATEELRERWEC